ncbi:hypothetical protein ACIBCN_25420 [Nocardia sp. NPDC051052]|uniref:hypothetical protein n=1 Tax=Nocardia sp. NPDC051052 TaxID=3364322 RepID=UPI0037A62557
MTERVTAAAATTGRTADLPRISAVSPNAFLPNGIRRNINRQRTRRVSIADAPEYQEIT